MFASFERFVNVYGLVNFSFFFVTFFHSFPMKDIYHFDVPHVSHSTLLQSDLNLNFSNEVHFEVEKTTKTDTENFDKKKLEAITGL